MSIKNETKNEVIVNGHRVIRSIWLQAFGLQFRKKLVDFGWVFDLPFQSRFAVTNLFVFQDIDVLWLDKDKKVLKKVFVEAWTPHVAGIKGTNYLIELPGGAAKTVKVGDTLSW